MAADGGDASYKDKDCQNEADEEYDKLVSQVQSYLPFLSTVINCDHLGIQKEHKDKLRSLYKMVDSQRLSTSKLKSCQSVFSSLYSKYNKILIKDEIKMANNPSVLLNEGKNKTKTSEIKLISDKSDQKLSKKSEHNSPISSLSIINNKTQNCQPCNLKNEVKQNKVFIKNKNEKSSKNTILKNEESIFKTDDLPEFSDSRLRLNKVIGFAANASIDKFKVSDITTSCSPELSKQIVDKFTKNKNVSICHNMLQGINMDDIDLNHMKKVMENINNKPVEPPPLPPVDLMDLGLTKVNVIESNSNNIIQDNVMSKQYKQPQHSNELLNNTIIPYKSTSIREKLNSDINVLHKIGSTNEPKQKYITSLKPGTIIDLENSKEIRSSLHIESLRPVIKPKETIISIEKNTDFKPTTDISIRDPRIKKNLMLNSENNVNVIKPPLQTNVQQLIPSVVSKKQNTVSGSIPSLLSLNLMPASNATLYESKPQEMGQHCLKNLGSQQELSTNTLSGFNDSNVSTNSQSSGHIVPKLNKYNLSTQNQCSHNLNEFTYDCPKNDLNQYSSFNQTHPHPIHHDEMFKNRELGLLSNYKNDIISKRDPRSVKSDSKCIEPQFRSFKEYREAKYGKEKNYFNVSSKYKKFSYKPEQDRYHSDKLKNKPDLKNCYSYNSFGAINDSACIKNFKIPKIKRKEEVDHDVQKELKSEIVKNSTEKEILSETIPYSYTENCTKAKTIVNCNTEKDLNFEIIRSSKRNTKEQIGSGTTNYNITEKFDKIELIKDDTERDLKTGICQTTHFGTKLNVNESDNICEVRSIESKENNIKEPKKLPYKPKKPKKYSKEKEFEKIVKQAVESLNKDVDTCGPRTRTRSSLKKKKKLLK